MDGDAVGGHEDTCPTGPLTLGTPVPSWPALWVSDLPGGARGKRTAFGPYPISLLLHLSLWHQEAKQKKQKTKERRLFMGKMGHGSGRPPNFSSPTGRGDRE
ncbi:hypothetical protein H1C71_004170 [Ictidomys tridecemlineatus]|nr:hypothetical protein H1C71_004170 [Ictidomys tridecemlineatus]KAG3277466.1 hypothetical protein H1C71_004170 [Ictidomys tridecemlineatus]KAG3277467.1 hypothetical protein H1C71_004170 [Ictidomys tridecemlineatus]